MTKMIKMSLATAMIMSVGSVSVQAADVNIEGVNILDNVKVNGEIRARYEMVDDSTLSNANALTNRLRIGVRADIGGTDWLSAYVEGTDVHNLNDNYNSSSNGETNHAVVADPEQTRLTQAYIDVKISEKRKLRLGRQMINLDNQRFVGAVGWRQMPQTFNAATFTCNTIDNLSVFASYITQINRVFDEDTTTGGTDGQRDTRTLLLNASYKVMPELKVTAYSYMIGEGTGGGGSDTYGLSLTGKIAVNDGLKVNYRAEYATQDDPSMENSGNPTKETVNADYYSLELGMNMDGILAGVGYESLSGEDGVAGGDTAFATPLATGHKFNGWADKFLGTPTAGLEDMSLYVGYKSKDFGLLKVVYHDFQSEYGSTDFGTEIDAVYKRAIPGVKNLSGLVKVADYNGDTGAPTASLARDTTKFWAMLTYKFASK